MQRHPSACSERDPGCRGASREDESPSRETRQPHPRFQHENHGGNGRNQKDAAPRPPLQQPTGYADSRIPGTMTTTLTNSNTMHNDTMPVPVPITANLNLILRLWHRCAELEFSGDDSRAEDGPCASED
jgi:hypothetical protein